MNVPDGMFGGEHFCDSVFQESSEDVSGGLPFLADLALGLSVLACSMLRILYNGPEVTKEEEACHDLLCSKLLQRYCCRKLCILHLPPTALQLLQLMCSFLDVSGR